MNRIEELMIIVSGGSLIVILEMLAIYVFGRRLGRRAAAKREREQLDWLLKSKGIEPSNDNRSSGSDRSRKIV